VLKKSRIVIAILNFLSTLKRTSISAFVLLLFINGISSGIYMGGGLPVVFTPVINFQSGIHILNEEEALRILQKLREVKTP